VSLPILIIGAGGHAAVVADALLVAGEPVLGYTDPETAKHGSMVCGLPVLGDDAVLKSHAPSSLRLANGIGGVRAEGARRAVQQRLEAEGWQFVQVRHPSCVVSPFASVDAGAQLLANCVVQAGARVGAGCIVNTAAVIEHDVVLGEFVHVAPGAVVCGNVHIGTGSHVGAGAVVRQGVRLGEHTLVGAGAVVVNDFAGGATLVGVPASSLEQQR
jgi:sugar O-acyltransferase (sialic acid O-acetyltransferase NeuD family)